MRGKDAAALAAVRTPRITPAYAGKSLPCFAGFIQSQDHPRLCGEKTISGMGDFNDKGSPPPMRGKAGYQLYNAADAGITPAYAGKSGFTMFF